MTVDVTELVMLKYHIDEGYRKIAVLEAANQELIDKLNRKCTHPTIITDRKYYSGGYDHVSSVVVSHSCTLCGKLLEYYDDPDHKGSYA